MGKGNTAVSAVLRSWEDEAMGAQIWILIPVRLVDFVHRFLMVVGRADDLQSKTVKFLLPLPYSIRNGLCLLLVSSFDWLL